MLSFLLPYMSLNEIKKLSLKQFIAAYNAFFMQQENKLRQQAVALRIANHADKQQFQEFIES